MSAAAAAHHNEEILVDVFRPGSLLHALNLLLLLNPFPLHASTPRMGRSDEG